MSSFSRLTMVVALLVSCPLMADQTAIDERADEVMKRMVKELEAASTLAFTAETTVDEVTVSGQKIQRGALVSVLVRRPDRALAVRDGDTGVRKFSFDGETITVYDPNLELYAKEEAPGTIDDALSFLRENYGLVLPLGDLVQSGLYEELRPRIGSGRYIGRHRVGRVPCHHLAFTMEDVDWQIWVEDGPRPLPRKVVITYKALPHSPQFTALIGEWRLSQPLPDKLLELQIPEGASRIEIMKRKGDER